MSRHVHTDVTQPTPVAPLRQVNHELAPTLYRRLAPWLHRLLEVGCKRDWDDFASLPQSGPAIVVGNHITSFDGPIVADYILYHGRYPYFLGKSSLWGIPGLGRLLRGIEQIPVYRGTDQASDSLVEARHKLEDGKVVLIFPEGTTTRDPLMWPFSAKTGAARLAIETGAPVIPFGHWGASTICPDNAGPQRWP
ncbi:MAG: 1-acyl-sn-glycerol-3-phosphate acyltransferase, partial [Propionibacteriaceae bacterium]|nr:1-acyl-sn-glycerol-3-phosphate acyltransferase [Propionibacteriaceae bacterium]